MPPEGSKEKTFMSTHLLTTLTNITHKRSIGRISQQKSAEHAPIRRPACRHAITAANTVARSSGAVLLVKNPKMDEPAPVPMPAGKTNRAQFQQSYNETKTEWMWDFFPSFSFVSLCHTVRTSRIFNICHYYPHSFTVATKIAWNNV